ncbi:PREDICTED: pseudouridine-metabolizing bifunctional protein C1861.05-like [Nicrophorus vespilloides]|uniref:Pseudouridine-metabolizing bifunctional protein C1861.05-like n=1 Tax=Nicrophorus vespilloides TaxID=110193 RepID=A0ABM1M8I7_NICVS|nr:PREDICTED: pseudouridine-metabolizing bifunctional protein C1861.05-like [Nicrophorus vespilloides]
MNLNSGMLFAVPVPAECSMDGTEIEAAIEDALALAKQKDVSGKDITPFLLSYLAKATNGRSLESNIALVRNNAKVAAEIAIALSDLEREKSRPVGSSDVVVVGGSILDRCARISDKHIELDGRVHYGRITENAGGVARNMSEALNKLRSHRPVAFISAIGDDSSGSLVAQSLGPHVEHLERVRGSRTAQCMVVLDSDGECKFLVGDMDVHARITPEMVNAKADLIADSKLIVLDGNPSLDTMETILELAHKNDISVFFEPTDVPICHKPFQCRYRSSIKYISPNLNELKCIAKSLNIPTSDKDVIYIAGRVAEYVSNIIVTMGSDGVLIVRRNSAKSKLHSEADQGPLQIRHYPASKVENLINVSGAGDCFASGIIAAMLEGMSEEICVSVGFESANKALYTDKTVPDYFFNREDEAWTKPAYYKIIK